MNDRFLGTTQHSQKENSQAEKISLRAFLSRREAKGTDEVTSRVTLLAELRLGEGSTFNSVTIEQLLEPNNVTFNCHSENLEKLNEFTSSNFSNYSESSHLQAVMTSETQNDHCEISPVARFRNKFGMTSPSKGMSEAKAEQQSTETLSFRCWCERCRLLRGRIGGQKCRKVDKQKRAAFTLAEVLITLGIIGVVAAMTLPVLLTNVQAKIRAEQIRSAKYKFSLATEKMARLNLIGPYDSTDAFVDELQKHLKISKRCNASNLRGCWPYATVDLGNGKTWNIADTKTGRY